MLCCVVPIEAPGCSAGAYADGVAGPSAAADVPVQETCEDLRARKRLLVIKCCENSAAWLIAICLA